jgi:anaerobic magnesium-protoporphyrin IX monomethyl ester cyclase
LTGPPFLLLNYTMRVLLINPFYPISETPSPPLGLAYLAAVLSAAGIEVKILDLVVFPYSRAMLQQVLAQFQPQMAGLTAVSMTFNFAADVIKDIKRLCPDIPTVMGGPHVSFYAQETLQRFPELDIVVVGEGEQTVIDLVRAVENGRGLEAVKGIAYRSGAGISCTPARNLISDLDTLPVPARHLLPLGRYRALGMPVSMTTSRGCPFKCIFCVGRKMVGARVRYRSPGKVVDEMEYLNTLHFHQINIADDLFTADKSHCLGVCDEIINRGLKLVWTSFARVDTVSEEILTRMKAAGCTAVSFGVESGNPQILKTIKKGITRKQVVAAVKMCRRAGITPFASFILGLPGETPQTIQETLNFGEQLKDLGLSFGFHLLAPFPGTEIRANSREYGIKILTDDWSQYHANRAIVETASVDRAMLDQIVISWENEYNQLLADIKQRMQTAEASAEEAEQLMNLERIVLVYDLMMKNAIEEKGGWSAEGRRMSPEENLKTLCENVGTLVDADPQVLHDTLDRARQQGNLKCSNLNARIQWQWTDHIE